MTRDTPREEQADPQGLAEPRDLESTQISGRPLPMGPEAARGGAETPAPLSDVVTNGGAITQWSVGQRLSDRFEIRSIAGMGGMGVVYRAHDQDLGCDVALKVLREGAEQERFTREARLLSQLDHENIVKYVAEGVAPNGQRFLAMEWLDGQDLASRLQQERLSIREAVAIARQVASALAVAHDLGVVHRDINPRNIFLVDKDPARVKVLDFGVARAPSVTHPLTSAGSPIGTPGYMAPEQAQGLASVTAAADVFGLGCVLYECLTGRRAFSGQTLMELFARILVDDVRPVRVLVSAVPPALDALVSKMLSKTASSRYQSGREVVEALRGIGPLSDEPLSEPSAPPSESAITDAEQRLSSIILLTRVSDTEFANVARASSQHGAEPQRLADGSVVVVLGNRGSATDQVAAAARCALDVRPCVAAAVIAVATGRAVTNGEKPIGEAIERASAALLEVAKSKSDAAPTSDSRVFVDRVTAGLLDARFDVVSTPAGLLLVGMRDEGEPIRTVLGRRTRCVGRRRELAFFDSTLEECVDDPVARAVLVTGVSGVGKTRLMHEFLRNVRRNTPELAVLM
ncbi:MAG TPA: serine/threonine-protein kinase, partial [Polyangiaceae bacterium]|nr:serine/threonine-protein kinase [Polyangiaceae bacterium]